MAAGKTVFEVSAEFNVHPKTVNSAKIEHLSSAGPPITRPELRRRAIAEACAGGETAEAVAQRFNCTLNLVKHACLSHNVTPTFEIKPLTDRNNTIVSGKQWEEVDWTKRDVDLAKLLGVSRERVRQVRRKLNKPRSPDHHRNQSFIDFREWFNADRKWLSQLTPTELAAVYPKPVIASTITYFLEKLGVVPKRTKTLTELITKNSLPNLVTKRQLDGQAEACWEWHKSAWRERLRVRGRQVNLYKYVHFLYNGESNGNAVVRTCHNDLCINPTHLLAVPKNQAGKYKKKGAAKKLTDAEVIEIRRRRKVGGAGNQLHKIAKDFGISIIGCWQITSGRTHKDLPS